MRFSFLIAAVAAALLAVPAAAGAQATDYTKIEGLTQPR